MSNRICASIRFSFKGETFQPSIEIDLDAFLRSAPSAVDTLEEQGLLTTIHPMLAASIQLDTYSYAYEVLQAGDVVYSNAMGMAVEHLKNGQFDFRSFAHAWQYEQQIQCVQSIARDYLSLRDMQQQPQWQDALLAAYQAGIKAR